MTQDLQKRLAKLRTMAAFCLERYQMNPVVARAELHTEDTYLDIIAVADGIESSRNLAIAGAFEAAAKVEYRAALEAKFTTPLPNAAQERILALIPAAVLAAQREHDKQIRHEATMAEHANHNRFMAEMYSILVDPVECTAINETEQWEACRKAALEQREVLHNAPERDAAIREAALREEANFWIDYGGYDLRDIGLPDEELDEETCEIKHHLKSICWSFLLDKPAEPPK